MRQVEEFCASAGVQAVVSDHHSRGGAGAADLARAVTTLADRNGQAVETSSNKSKDGFKFLYPDEMPLHEKVSASCFARPPS
eukprot:SAG11_NODE_3089_length_2702_cov_3.781022_7_plen_82_part_00